MKVNELPTQIMSDQPTECINCGARTEFIEFEEFGQVHVCQHCKEVFFVEEDEE